MAKKSIQSIRKEVVEDVKVFSRMTQRDRDRIVAMTDEEYAAARCHDCNVYPGQLHKPSCDVERCPFCGHQMLMCLTTEDDDPESPTIYDCSGEEFKEDDPLLPWTGEWPGCADAEELGMFCKMVAGKGWVTCDKSDPEARPDLNTLAVEAVWDREKFKYVLREDVKPTLRKLR